MKYLLIGLGLLILLPILFFAFFLISVDIDERNDNKMIENIEIAGNQLYQYEKQHDQFPSTLAQANIQEKVCVTFKCIQFHYQVYPDKKNFTLAASNGGFIFYFSGEKENTSFFGMAISERLGQTRKDFPIYRKDKRFFATPSAWPILNEE